MLDLSRIPGVPVFTAHINSLQQKRTVFFIDFV